jgi:CDP-diglyceride synthetase
MTGDAVKSFFKRRLGITPGKSWFPFDQLDFVLGAILFVSIIKFPGLGAVIVGEHFGVGEPDAVLQVGLLDRKSVV